MSIKNIEDKLSRYFSREDIDKILKDLGSKQRASILNDDYFTKVGKNTDKLFFNNLTKEIRLYDQNRENEYLPKLVDYYIDDNYCLLILEKLRGVTLSNTRNDFNLNISSEKRYEISRAILNIKDIRITFNIANDYNRKDKFDKYFNRSLKYLEDLMILKLKKLNDKITEKSDEYVISHGDLIGPNIMIYDDKISFIDWEYISLKPRYYDLVYFLLFSKEDNCLTDLTGVLNYRELYNDGIIICLKEIQNWAKLFDKVENDIVISKIERWKRELNYILDKYE